MPGEGRRVDGELGEVVENLLVLQLGQGTPLIDRPLTEVPARAAGRQAHPGGEE